MASPVRLSVTRAGSGGYAGFARTTRFELQSAVRNGGHGRRRPNGRRYRAGETVRQSGIYEVLHDRGHRETHEVVMISGQQFPDCETCHDKVRFRLVRTAPYIFQDEDFEEEDN
jgi:hypothetical protein